MLGIFLKIFYFIDKEVNINGQDKGFGENTATWGKNKKGN